MTDSHYERLGVERDATKEEIRAAYRDRLEELRTEVEKGRSDRARDGAREETARLNAAWQVLSDPFQRQRYDAATSDGHAGETEDEIDQEEKESAPVPARRRGGREPRGRDERGRPQRREPVGVADAEAAPVGRRLAALAIDLLVMGAVYLAIVNITSTLVDPDDQSVGFLIAVITALFLVFNLYFVLPTARTGQTLGKRLVHIMVVDAETGQLPSWRRASMRYIVPVVLIIGLPGSLGLMVALLFGVSWLLIDTRIGLMDRLARTRVVVARYRPERTSQ
jgi:uncharacterized RDD family membrane protein YckC/DnaJ-domain-containing protein 1